MTGMTEYLEARERVAEKIEGLECAIEISRAIVKVYQDELDAFTAERGPDFKPRLRIITAVVDERNNAARLEKEVSDLLLLLAGPPVSREFVEWLRGQADDASNDLGAFTQEGGGKPSQAMRDHVTMLHEALNALYQGAPK
jgi:hypothetical protein